VTPPFETFDPLAELPFLFHAFTLRTDAPTRDDNYEQRLAAAFGYEQWARAEQTHGNGVAFVTAAGAYPGVDALVTTVVGLLLVIRCADCAPVFLVDRVRPAIALVHSGKKGTLANVVGATVAAMPSHPSDLLAFIGPSIGPCHYDMDIWTPIEQQLRAAGVREVYNPRQCTACRLDRYFSYRAEKGRTGRLFALLSLRQAPGDGRREPVPLPSR